MSTNIVILKQNGLELLDGDVLNAGDIIYVSGAIVSVQWTGVIASNSTAITVSVSGTYTATVIIGSETVIISRNIAVNPIITLVRADTNTELKCDPFVLPIGTEIRANPSEFNYQWVFNGQIVGNLQTFTPTVAGSYTVVLIHPTNLNLTSSRQFNLRFDLIVRINNSMRDISCGSSYVADTSQQLSAIVSNGSGNFTIKWLVNSIEFNTNSITITDPSIYNIELIVTDSDPNICKSTCKITVRIVEPLTVVFNPPGPINTGLNRSATILAVPIGGTGPYTYQWSIGDTPLSIMPTITVNQSGTYQIEVTDADNYIAINTIDVNIPIKLNLLIQNGSNTTTVFDNESIQLENIRTVFTTEITGGSGRYNYQWLVPSFLINHNESVLISTAPLVGSYQVIVTDANNITNTDTIRFNVDLVYDTFSVNIKLPNGQIASDTNTNLIGLTDSLSANVVGGIGPFVYNWIFNGILVSSNTTFDPKLDGFYKLIVLDVGTNRQTQYIAQISTPMILFIADESDEVLVDEDQFDLILRNPDTKLKVIIDNGTGPFTYIWTLPDESILTTPTISVSLDGNYSVAVTDINSKRAIKHFEVKLDPDFSTRNRISINNILVDRFSNYSVIASNISIGLLIDIVDNVNTTLSYTFLVNNLIIQSGTVSVTNGYVFSPNLITGYILAAGNNNIRAIITSTDNLILDDFSIDVSIRSHRSIVPRI